MTTAGWRRSPATRAGLAAAVCAVAGLVWAATGGGYFWPRWVWFALVVVLAAEYLTRRALRVPPGRRRWLALDAAFCALLAPVEVTIWAMTGGGLFWPIGPILVLSTVFGTHVWITSRRPDPRETELAERVDTLTRTRRGAMDHQIVELERVERDLHDGAQARLVSLALTLGMAEDLVRRDPDAAVKLLTDARGAAVTALEDLRAVMHSIRPPVLADRGLRDAVRALALDIAVPVTVAGEPPAGLPAAVETAGYFAVAECLANTVKHSHATAAHVTFVEDGGGVLRVDVEDDGTGGVDPDRGTGLRGIMQRLEALDGQVRVHSPAGGPTRVSIVIPIPDASTRD